MKLTIYFNDESEVVAKSAAEGQGGSLSRWVCQAIREKSLAEWPVEVRNLGAAFPGWPMAERNEATNAPREPFE